MNSPYDCNLTFTFRCRHKLCSTCYGNGKMRKCPAPYCQNSKLKPSDFRKDAWSASLIQDIQKAKAILYEFHDPNAKPRVLEDIALEDLGSIAAEISNDGNSKVRIISDVDTEKRSSTPGTSHDKEISSAGSSKEETKRMDQELEIPPSKIAKKTNQKSLIKCSLKENKGNLW